MIDAEKHDEDTVEEPLVGIAKVLSQVIPAGILLVTVFWISALWLYGMLFRQGNHVSQVHIPVVDFDGGSMGQALQQSAESLSATYGYPTYDLLPASFSSPEQLRQDVYEGKYWAALYIEAGSTARWEAAINGSSTTGAYAADDTIKYILNDARYYTFYQQSFLSTSLQVSQSAAAMFTQRIVGPRLAAATSPLSATQSQAFLTAARPVEINANAEAAGAYTAIYDKVLYNTVGGVLPILLQFFFLMALNGILAASNAWTNWRRSTIYALRHTARFVWPLVASLCSVGWSWAFKGDAYALSGGWFMAWWAVTYLYCMVSFNIMDLATTVIPLPFISSFVLPWVILSVSSTLCSPQILHHWYRVNYFFPAHHWWEITMMTLTEGGLTHHLRYALPVLLVWWVVSLIICVALTPYRINKEQKAAAAGGIGH